jgi:hypothetical protein
MEQGTCDKEGQEKPETTNQTEQEAFQSQKEAKSNTVMNPKFLGLS